MTTNTHHNMHHSKFNGNYGVHFRFWDKLFGTEFKDYEATFDAIQNRKSGVVAKETAEIGEVSMKRTDALSTEELNNGMILACQSTPVTEELEIVYS